jgi:hypothetical protein
LLKVTQSVISFHRLSLFHPFEDSTGELRLRSFSSIGATPSVVYTASLNHLKRLIYVHHIRKPRLPTKCWFNPGMLRVSTELVKKAATDPNLYFYSGSTSNSGLMPILTIAPSDS